MRFDLKDLNRVIQKYEARTTSLDELKATILATADRVTEYDRRAFREFLLETEGRLDLIQFCTDTHRVHAATLPVLHELKQAMEQDE